MSSFILIAWALICCRKSYAAISVDEFLSVLARKVHYTGTYPGSYPPIQMPIDHRNIIEVHLRGKGISVRTLQVYDPTHRLMNASTFTPSDYIDGFHKVGFFCIQEDHRAICIKQEPEAPGLEIASEQIHQVVCDANSVTDATFNSTIAILMNDIMFSVSRFIEGENLHDVLRAKKGFQEYCFNQNHISVMIQWAFLTNSEDFRPKNCIVRERNGYAELVGIDRERSFGHHCKIVEERTVRAHSFLNSSQEMYLKMPKGSFNIPFLSIQYWILAMTQEHFYQISLKQFLKRKSNSILGVPIATERIYEILTKMVTIAACIEKERTLMHALEYTNPSLAALYKTVNPSKNILESIHATVNSVDAGRFGDRTPPSAGDITEYLGKDVISIFDDLKMVYYFLTLLQSVLTPNIPRPKIMAPGILPSRFKPQSVVLYRRKIKKPEKAEELLSTNNVITIYG